MMFGQRVWTPSWRLLSRGLSTQPPVGELIKRDLKKQTIGSVFHKLIVMGLLGTTAVCGYFIFDASAELYETKKAARIAFEASEAEASTGK
jgi:hypothetical protein